MAVYPGSELVEKAHLHIGAFFSSFQEGTLPLTSFLANWTAFEDSIRAQHNVLTVETLNELLACISVISSVASGLVSLENETDAICEQLTSDISRIIDNQMSTLIIRDENPCPSVSTHTPAYVKPAFDWLLANLHNPYPSKSWKASVCRQTGASAKSIEAWFKDIRHRIGWNQLRKSCFSNRQDDIVEAAIPYFKVSQLFPCQPSDFNAGSTKNNWNLEFAEIQQRAHNLYGDLFGEPTSSANGDQRSSRRPPGSRESNTCRRSKKRARPASSYPSPSPSLSHSRSPSPWSPERSISCERRSPSFDSCHSDVFEPHRKRPRLDTCDLSRNVEQLPSPAPSNSVLETDCKQVEDRNARSKSCSSIASHAKRKRAASDADRDGPIKRPHYTFPPPSLGVLSNTAVSGEFLDLETWLHQASVVDFSSQIPPPIQTSCIDETSLDVEVCRFDYLFGGDVSNEGQSSNNKGQLMRSTFESNLVDLSFVPQVFEDNEVCISFDLGSQVNSDDSFGLNILNHSPPSFPLTFEVLPNEYLESYGVPYIEPTELDFPMLPNRQDSEPCVAGLNWRPHVLQESSNYVRPTDKHSRIEQLRKELQRLESEAT